MGEQTILCGVLQTGAILSFDKMVAEGIEAGLRSQIDSVRMGNHYRSFKARWNHQHDGSFIKPS